MYNDYMADSERRMGGMIGNYYCMAHVIRPGDTLYKLSREYGVKVSALMMANPFVDIYNLRIGDELCIPRLRRVEAGAGNERATDTQMRIMPMPSPEEQRLEDERNNRTFEDCMENNSERNAGMRINRNVNLGSDVSNQNINIRRNMSDLTDANNGRYMDDGQSMSDADMNLRMPVNDENENMANGVVDINADADDDENRTQGNVEMIRNEAARMDGSTEMEAGNGESCRIDTNVRKKAESVTVRRHRNVVQMPQENWRMYTRENLTQGWMED